MVIGHQRVRQLLEQKMLPVMLLLGPRSVGKWTLANHLADHYGVLPSDRYLCEQLTIDHVRSIIRFAMTAPFGQTKLALLRLDGAHPAALNALLKTLEEPPDSARFIMTASQPPLPTIVSRAQVFWCGLLSEDELTAILVQRYDMSETTARKAAALGFGRVETAVRTVSLETSRPAVLAMVRAVAIKDRQLFDRALRNWDEGASYLFVDWLREALTRDWKQFSQADTFGLVDQPELLRQVALALTKLPAARPRLRLRAVLEPLLDRS